MKAMILAAGKGERMRPLSSVRAKPALPVLNRPLLHRTLDELVRHGIREVVINTHHLPGTIHDAVGTGQRWGVRVTWSDESTILGTGGGLRRARAAFGDGPVLVVNGDVVFDVDLTSLVARHRSSGALVSLGLRPNPDVSAYLPVVTRERGRVVWLPGLPSPPLSGSVRMFTGIQVVEARAIDRLEEVYSDSIRDLAAPLVRESPGLVRGVPLRGMWHDLGRPALYLRAQLALLRREVGGPLVHSSARVGQGCRIERSVLGSGVVVGPNTRIEGCVVWDGALIGTDARIRASIIADAAVVPDGAVVENRVMIGNEEDQLS